MYSHDGEVLHDLFSQELTRLLGTDIDLSLSYLTIISLSSSSHVDNGEPFTTHAHCVFCLDLPLPGLGYGATISLAISCHRSMVVSPQNG